MMYVSDLNDAFDHKISGGDNYLWTCWPNARYIEYKSDYAYVSAVFNTETQEVYEVNISVANDEDWENEVTPYRWLNPDFKQEYIDEAKSRDVNHKQAWDEVEWYDLETAEDFLEKAVAIFNGDDSFDRRVQVPLDLPDSDILKIALMAHERDITLNQMVEEMLRIAIERHKEENE